MPDYRMIRVRIHPFRPMHLAAALLLVAITQRAPCAAADAPIALTLTLSADTQTEPATDIAPSATKIVPIEIPATTAAEMEPGFAGSMALRIERDGTVKRVVFDSARPSLAIGRIIEATVKQWTFTPPTRDGRAVSVLMRAVYTRTPPGQDDAPQLACLMLPAYPAPLFRPAGLSVAYSEDVRPLMAEPPRTAIPMIHTSPVTGKQGVIFVHPSQSRSDSSVPEPASVPAPWFSGHVTLRATIDTAGLAKDIHVVRSTCSLFEPYAAAALAATRFRPRMDDGQPVESSLVVPIPIPGTLANQAPLLFRPVPTTDGAAAWDEPPLLVHLALPIYPADLLEKRVSGRAEIRVELDANGAITGTELLRASHPEFGQAFQASIAACAHAPARRGGKRVASTLLRTAVFDPGIATRTPVETETPGVALPWTGDGKPVDAASLDTPLRAIVTRVPAFANRRSGAEPAGSATVELIIDRDGTVCEPRVVRASSESAGYAAVQAVASWLYVPPRAKGVPVPVRTTVTFPSPPPAER